MAKVPKRYSDEIELAIEERIRDMLTTEPELVRESFVFVGRLSHAYLSFDGPHCYVIGLPVGPMVDEAGMPDGDVAIKRMRYRLQIARAELLKANRRIRGTTTKQLRSAAEAARSHTSRLDT